jgi:ribosomal protein L16 Arg81 hydroxylase
MPKSAIAALLDPYSVTEFLQSIWTQKCLWVPSQGNRRFHHLYSWQHLSDLLNTHEFDFPTLRLALDEKVLDPGDNQKLLQRCQEGATLILDRVHKFVPAIADFAFQLQQEIGHPVQVNSYCSYPQRQGFRCHYDTHDVFILQIDGCKEWHIFSDTLKYPLKDQKSVSLVPPEQREVLTCVLEPGDLLYIPRGHWHYAIAQSPSLHLTVGVLAKTGIDFAEWLITQLKTEEVWRENLPLHSSSEQSNHVDALAQALIAKLQDTDVQGRYLSELAHTMRSRSLYSFPYQTGWNIFAQGMRTQFSPIATAEPQIRCLSADTYQVEMNGKEITLCGVPAAFVQQLFSQPQFSAADIANWLPGFDWESEVVPVVTRLVTEGILLVKA